MRQTSKTLAGRVAYLDLVPIDALEIPAQVGNTDRLWLRGGFPESVLAAADTPSLDWRRDFIPSYIDRDVPMLAPRMPAEKKSATVDDACAHAGHAIEPSAALVESGSHTALRRQIYRSETN